REAQASIQESALLATKAEKRPGGAEIAGNRRKSPGSPGSRVIAVSGVAIGTSRAICWSDRTKDTQDYEV
ncbi:MAG TPA: hypothetical protein VH024_00775, partial [Candidatus Angelobacter sp.]|nr:hypothetical protein [Candidatus Angelobacter sp.]